MCLTCSAGTPHAAPAGESANSPLQGHCGAESVDPPHFFVAFFSRKPARATAELCPHTHTHARSTPYAGDCCAPVRPIRTSALQPAKPSRTTGKSPRSSQTHEIVACQAAAALNPSPRLCLAATVAASILPLHQLHCSPHPPSPQAIPRRPHPVHRQAPPRVSISAHVPWAVSPCLARTP